MSESLKDLLDKLSHLDDDDLPDEFDAALLVGDIKDKVDSIKWKIDAWEAEAENIEKNWIAELKRRSDSLKKKAECLYNYMKKEMIAHENYKLPGNLFRAQIQKTKASVVIDVEAGPEHFLAYPELVVQKINYAWSKDAIKDKIDNGTELPFARLKEGHCVRFYPTAKPTKE
jgi:hypothetical protein